jgi:hypothetical protein
MSTTSDDQLFNQILTSIATIQRDLDLLRSVVDSRMSRMRRNRQYGRQGEAVATGRQPRRRPRQRRRQIDLLPQPPAQHEQPPQLATEEEILQAVVQMSLNESYEEANRPRVTQEIRLPKLKTKVLKNAELNAYMTDTCAICQDTHKICDSITTSCDHHFGQECFLEWVRAKKSTQQDVSCPLCMKTKFTYHGFRARKTPTARAHNGAVEGT